MPTKPYFEALNDIKPFIFRVLTPSGSGTGFQISYYHLSSQRKALCGVATAAHVIAHANEWEYPIKLQHFQSGKSVVLKHNERVIFTYTKRDLAFILFENTADLPIRTEVLELIEEKRILKQGAETGWCGFPVVEPEKLCFFAGHISCSLGKEKPYLIDGVAINGVSGGPAFYIAPPSNETKIYGVISAYRPNWATGEALPGVSIVSSVQPYHGMLRNLKSLAEAEEKAQPEKERQKKAADDRPKQISKTKPKKKAALKGNLDKNKPTPKRKVASRKQKAQKPAKKKSIRRGV